MSGVRSGEFKVVLLGEGRVGKTSIISRFVSGTFNEAERSTTQATMYSSKMVPIHSSDQGPAAVGAPSGGGGSSTTTADANHYVNSNGSHDHDRAGPSPVVPSVDREGKGETGSGGGGGGGPQRVVKLAIWDTAGQERFHALAPIYYRNAAGAMLVYDVCDRDSLGKVQTWVRELRTVTGDRIRLVICGNKCDCPPAEHEVSPAEALAVAAEFGAEHHFTSAKSGLGVAEAFGAMATAVYEDSRAAAGDGGGGGGGNSGSGGGSGTGGYEAPDRRRRRRAGGGGGIGGGGGGGGSLGDDSAYGSEFVSGPNTASASASGDGGGGASRLASDYDVIGLRPPRASRPVTLADMEQQQQQQLQQQPPRQRKTVDLRVGNTGTGTGAGGGGRAGSPTASGLPGGGDGDGGGGCC